MNAMNNDNAQSRLDMMVRVGSMTQAEADELAARYYSPMTAEDAAAIEADVAYCAALALELDIVDCCAQGPL